MATAEIPDLTEEFIQFFRNYYREDVGRLAQKYPNELRSLHVDYDDLYQFNPNLAEDYQHNPEEFRQYAEEALRLYDLPAAVSLSNAHVRVFNVDTVDISSIRVHDDHIGNLIAVTGIVRKATDVRPRVTEAAFECQRCGTLTYIPQTDSGFQEPHECQGCERQGPFRVDFDKSEFVDSQKIRVQESPEGLRGGETPQSIDVDIEDDITGLVTAGDHVTVTGVLHIQQQTSGTEKMPIFDLYMDGVDITIEDEDLEELEISDENKAEIHDLATRDTIYEDMVGSVAPAIYGYDDQKLAMILQLFSGVRKNLPDGTRIRGDLHMLFIGDPGTAKSQLLSYIQTIAPRSVYTSGKGSSSAGLTAAAVRDDFGDSQQWTLEAGALVLADKGVAAVDELDKMRPADRSAMHEALEQQQISVAKAGINATLKSRCSLIGAANPKHGRFDQYEPIGQQIDLEPALISRFDLIFTVTDQPDPTRDGNIADHILDTNFAGEMNTHQERLAKTDVPQDQVDAATSEVAPEIDTDLLRKYIAYAKRTCVPMMTPEARSVIRDFYVDLRSTGVDQDAPVPVTARKLEALVRLAEASARVRLSNRVSVNDAERVISLVRSCLEDVGLDTETGQLDADIVETGQPKSQRDRVKAVGGIIEEVFNEVDGNAPLDTILSRAENELELDRQIVVETIETLKIDKGACYEPADDQLKWLGWS